MIERRRARLGHAFPSHIIRAGALSLRCPTAARPGCSCAARCVGTGAFGVADCLCAALLERRAASLGSYGQTGRRAISSIVQARSIVHWSNDPHAPSPQAKQPRSVRDRTPRAPGRRRLHIAEGDRCSAFQGLVLRDPPGSKARRLPRLPLRCCRCALIKENRG